MKLLTVGQDRLAIEGQNVADTIHKWVLVMGLLTISDTANAGPDEITQWLMRDPMSMMDYGIMRINTMINAEPNPITGTVGFDFDTNRIEIARYGITGNVQVSAELSEAACASWIDKIRLTALIDLATGKPYLETSYFAQMFSHEGYTRGAEPKDLYTRVDPLFTLNCTVKYSETDGKTGYLTITSPLLGTGYSVKKD